MNKRGQITGILVFVGGLAVVLMIGFLMAMGGSVLDWMADETVPELTSLGQAGDTNLTEISEYTITPVNTMIQSIGWIIGILYVFMLVGCLGLAYAFKVTGEKWLIGLFFLLMIVLVIMAIFMSNIYEDFYDDTGEIGDRLKGYTLLSYLILHSPIILTIIGFIGGIIMFAGAGREEHYA